MFHKALAFVGLKETEQQFLRFFVGKYAKFERVLNVHHLVADVVGRLYEIDQRIAHSLRSLRTSGEGDAQFGGYPLVTFALALKETKLALAFVERGGVGIFHDAGQGAVRQHESALASAFKLMGKQSQCIGIAVEMRQVGPCTVVDDGGVARFASRQIATLTFGEITTDGFLATMTKGRIAHIVGEAGGRDDRAKFGKG